MKKKDRRHRLRLGAKLRLFAAVTNRKENPEKLHDAVVDHLERVRIQAEVTVVDLAGADFSGADFSGADLAEWDRAEDRQGGDLEHHPSDRRLPEC